MPLVCDACNRFRSSEDKLIGVILVNPTDCAACGRPLTQKNCCKVGDADVPVIKARIGPSRIDRRKRPCCMCARDVVLLSSTTKNPEASEMLQPPEGAWIGFVRGDHAPEMIVVCSEACRRNLLSH